MTTPSADTPTRFLAPLREVARIFIPLHARRLTLVVTLGILGSGLNSAGYLSLLPLVQHAASGGDTLRLGLWPVSAGPAAFAGVIALVVTLVIGALQVNYLVYCQSLVILQHTVTEAAVRGLLRLESLAGAIKFQPAVNEVAGAAAFACGFVMRQIAVGLSEALQLLVFLALLFWLNPWLTGVFLVLLVPAGLLYAQSVARVARSAANNKDLAKSARTELAGLAEALAEGDLSEADLRARMTELHRSGATGRLLEGKVDVRREMRRGPLLIEYLFPLALVIFPLLALATGGLREQVGPIVVYVLALRNVIGLLQRLASLVISVGRFFPALLCHVDLLTGAREPRCRFFTDPHPTGEDDDPEFG